MYQRTVKLWGGRFKSSLVATDHYFLTVSRYIELNPVRAGMVRLPGEYPWSSYRHNGMGMTIGFITEHSIYTNLEQTRSSRILKYRALFERELPLSVLQEIRLCIIKDWVIGNEYFKKQIEDACQ
jgi:putative transposase